jgi:hypothetical protein
MAKNLLALIGLWVIIVQAQALYDRMRSKAS